MLLLSPPFGVRSQLQMTSSHISHPRITHSSHRVSSDPFSWNKCLVKKKEKKGLLASWFSIVEASACLTELIKKSCDLTVLASPFPDTHSLTQKHTRCIPFSTSATNTYLFCLFFPSPSLHTRRALPPASRALRRATSLLHCRLRHISRSSSRAGVDSGYTTNLAYAEATCTQNHWDRRGCEFFPFPFFPPPIGVV